MDNSAVYFEENIYSETIAPLPQTTILHLQNSLRMHGMQVHTM